MDVERYARIRGWFDAVVDIAAGQRRVELQALGADANQIDEVLELIRRSELHNTEQLDQPLRAALKTMVAEAKPGDQFGVWRVEREIAQGGMGAVYLVQRDDGHYTQTAALKFIKGSPRAEAIEYFARERQLLASLTHPQIARLLDGGATAHGRPYLVMEYIDGVPIDQFCGSQKLGVNAVLELFVSACAAVAFAHRQLVVHCDLKPSNLLVTKDGRPILLDFGIAQLAHRVGGDETLVVDVETARAIAYTPRYASPEQRLGARVTTASDIYSLGTVLSDLLAPVLIEKGRERELRALIDKASHQQPDQRYATVDALCADIECYRNQQPMQAMPATLGYRLHKLVLRRWPVLLAAAAFALTVAAFTGKVVIESRRAQAAEQAALAARDRAVQAEIEARSSEAAAMRVSQFLTSVFDGANPDADTGNVPTAVLLDQALQRVERDLSAQPATQSQLYAALASVQYTIEQTERGRDSYARAIAIERTQNRPLVLAQMLIDSALWRLRHFDGNEALGDAREALALVEQHSPTDSMLRIDVLNGAASMIGAGGDQVEAAALFERAIGLARRLDPGSLRLADVLGSAAWQRRGMGNLDGAIALMRETVELQLQLVGEHDDKYLSSLDTLAGTLGLARRFDESEESFQRAIAVRRAAGGLESKSGAWALAEYARMLTNAGRPLDALPIYVDVMSIADRKVADDGAARAVWHNNYASAAERAGNFDLAEFHYRAAIALAEKLWEPQGSGVATLCLSYGRTLLQALRLVDAGLWLQRSRDFYMKSLPVDNEDLLTARIEYARWLRAVQRNNEARLELAAIEPHEARLPPAVAARLTHTEALLLADGGVVEQSLAQLEHAESAMRAALGDDDARSWLIMLDRAQLLRVHGRHREAAAVAEKILANVKTRLDPASPLLARIRSLSAPP